MVAGSISLVVGSSSRMTNHISGGKFRLPVRPIRCKKEETIAGASIWKARCNRPISIPNSNVAVVTVVWNWVSSFMISSAVSR